ncbi:MAG: hypothetical protein J6P61_01345 [Erysipelotrichaceae bacterium]|nr:hypothetical protein [Erysipelotrichaceae bacterium]
MKRIIGLLLAFMLVLVGCSSQSDGSSADNQAKIDSLKTMGDIFALGDDISNEQITYDEKLFGYGFEYDGIYYRVLLDLPKDISKKIWSIEDTGDFEAKNKEVKEIVSSLEFEKIENLTEGIPSQEELDKWIGKTGKDLTDDGWTGFGYNLVDMEFYMNHGPYSFIVVFDGSLTDVNDMDDAEIIKDLKIKSITYETIGDIFPTE